MIDHFEACETLRHQTVSEMHNLIMKWVEAADRDLDNKISDDDVELIADLKGLARRYAWFTRKAFIYSEMHNIKMSELKAQCKKSNAVRGTSKLQELIRSLNEDEDY